MPQEDRNKFYNASKYYLVDIFNNCLFANDC